MSQENLPDSDENISSLNIETDQDDIDNNDKDKEDDQREKDDSEYKEEAFKDWKQSVEDEALQNAAIKISEKTDGLTGQARDTKEDMLQPIHSVVFYHIWTHCHMVGPILEGPVPHLTGLVPKYTIIWDRSHINKSTKF